MKLTSEILYLLKNGHPFTLLHCQDCGKTFKDQAEKLEYLQKHFPDRYPSIVSANSSSNAIETIQNKRTESEPEVLELPNANGEIERDEDAVEIYISESDLEDEIVDLYSEDEVDINFEDDPSEIEMEIQIAPEPEHVQVEKNKAQETRVCLEETEDLDSSDDYEPQASPNPPPAPLEQDNENHDTLVDIPTQPPRIFKDPSVSQQEEKLSDDSKTENPNGSERFPSYSSGDEYMQPITPESAIVSHRSSQISYQSNDSLLMDSSNENAAYSNGLIETSNPDPEGLGEREDAMLLESDPNPELSQHSINTTDASVLLNCLPVDCRSTSGSSGINELALERVINLRKRQRSRSPSVEFIKEVKGKRQSRNRQTVALPEVIPPCSDANLALAIKVENTSNYELLTPPDMPICNLEEPETTIENGNLALLPVPALGGWPANLSSLQGDGQEEIHPSHPHSSFLMIEEGNAKTEPELLQFKEEKISITNVKIECKTENASVKTELDSPRRGRKASHCSFCGSDEPLPAEISIEGKVKTETPAACQGCRNAFVDLKIIISGTSRFFCSKAKCNRKFSHKSGVIYHFRSHTKVYGTTNSMHAPKVETRESDSDNDTVVAQTSSKI